ncbi:hypothetical protein GV827_21540 [Sulfitobacter sp. JBTF-M27]|uniref:Uncharacterized protein n=1 Tax=Sulfitobacter sediminilitoris TaxID=2698830 RepID=A0A6P0CIN5_9RHOB|nr:hypothetical protein [Sulfitobacter sediminilitoris]
MGQVRRNTRPLPIPGGREPTSCAVSWNQDRTKRPLPCGSGRKYKRCCGSNWGTIEVMH